jgi:hypothetical protein
MPNLYDRTKHPVCTSRTVQRKVAFKTDVAIFAKERGLTVLAACDWNAVKRKGHGQPSVVVAAREIRFKEHFLPFSVDRHGATELLPFPIHSVPFAGQYL